MSPPTGRGRPADAPSTGLSLDRLEHDARSVLRRRTTRGGAGGAGVRGVADGAVEGVGERFGGERPEREGAVAAPSAVSRCAQNGWSAVTGTGTAGTPARSPAAAVPAPAWWTTAAVRGNSSAWGTSPTVRTSSPSAASPALPVCRMPRRPAARRARTAISLNRSPCPRAMLPKPTNTGGGPAARKSSTSGGSRSAGSTYGHQVPATSRPGRQSEGRGTSAVLKPCRTGQSARSWRRRVAAGVSAGSSSRRRGAVTACM